MKLIEVSRNSGRHGNFEPDYAYCECIGSIKNLAVYQEQLFTLSSVRTVEVSLVEPWSNKQLMTLELQRVRGNVWKVCMVSVGRKYRGYGLPVVLYKFLVQNTDMVIRTYMSQSAGGKSIWYRLAQDPDLLVSGWRSSEQFHVEVDDSLGELVTHEGKDIYASGIELILENR